MRAGRKPYKPWHQEAMEIAYDYSAFVENQPRGMIKDASLLPHDKERIIEAVIFAIANAKIKFEAKAFGMIITALAFYQYEVGESINFPDQETMTHETLEAWAKGDGFKKWHHFQTMVTDDMARLAKLVGRAEAANPKLNFYPSWLWGRWKTKGIYGVYKALEGTEHHYVDMD